MLADRVLSGPSSRQYTWPSRVVEQLNLPDAELIRPLVAGVVGDLRDGLVLAA